jgi:hypothetical protein
MEKTQQKQKELLEQYEVTMKNDILWNGLSENMIKFSHSSIISTNYELRDILHFYFGKPLPSSSSSASSSGSQNIAKVQLLQQLLTDLTKPSWNKNNQESFSSSTSSTVSHFPFPVLQEILQMISSFLLSLIQCPELSSHPSLNNQLKSFGIFLEKVKIYEEGCYQTIQEISSFLHQSSTSSLNQSQQLAIMNKVKSRIDSLLSSEKENSFHSFLSSFQPLTDLTSLENELQERIDMQTEQNKELINQQLLLKTLFPFILLSKKHSISSYQQLKNQAASSFRGGNQTLIESCILEIKDLLINMESHLKGKKVGNLAVHREEGNDSSSHRYYYSLEDIINKIILSLSKRIFSILRINNSLVNMLFIEIIETIFLQILSLSTTAASVVKGEKRSSYQDRIVLYAMIVYGIYHELKNSSLQKQFVKILLLSFSSYDILIPNYILPSSSSFSLSKEKESKSNEGLLLWFSSLLLYSNDNNNDLYHVSTATSTKSQPPASSTDHHLVGPLSFSHGFSYLVHTVQQLYYLHYFNSSSSCISSSASSLWNENDICSSLLLFLKYTGHIFWMKYQTKYEETLSSLLSLSKQICDACKNNKKDFVSIQQLIVFLEKALNEKSQQPLFYNFQSSFVLHSVLFVR